MRAGGARGVGGRMIAAWSSVQFLRVARSRARWEGNYRRSARASRAPSQHPARRDAPYGICVLRGVRWRGVGVGEGRHHWPQPRRAVATRSGTGPSRKYGAFTSKWRPFFPVFDSLQFPKLLKLLTTHLSPLLQVRRAPRGREQDYQCPAVSGPNSDARTVPR